MFGLQLKEEAGTDLPANFKDPFDSDKISAIHMHFYPGSGWSSSVEFKNGMTEGTQKFENKDLSAIVKEMEAFVNSL